MFATREQILLTLKLLRSQRYNRAVKDYTVNKNISVDAYAIHDYDQMIEKYLNG